MKKHKEQESAPKSEHHTENTHLYHFNHANLYYLMMVVSSVLFIFFIVQGIRYHLDDELTFAMCFYIIAVLLAIIAKSSHNRGKGHYHYHGHLRH
jgi:hypothetical protein